MNGRIRAGSGMFIEDNVTVTVRDARGRFVLRRTFHNTLTNYARATVAKWLVAVATNIGQGALLPPDRIALGTGTGTPAQTDTALWLETASTRKVNSSRQVVSGYYAQYLTQYQTTDPAGTFTESGLFDAAGNLWAHVSLGNVSKSATQVLTIQWKIQVKGN